VLEDQLLLAVVLKQHGILVKRPDFPGQLDPADKIDRNRSLILPNCIQERVLNILCRLVFHVPISCFLSDGLDAQTTHASKINHRDGVGSPEAANSRNVTTL
jgi:hypothetical protein